MLVLQIANLLLKLPLRCDHPLHHLLVLFFAFQTHLLLLAKFGEDFTEDGLLVGVRAHDRLRDSFHVDDTVAGVGIRAACIDLFTLFASVGR